MREILANQPKTGRSNRLIFYAPGCITAIIVCYLAHLYIGVSARDHTAALKKLGKYKKAGGCLFINKLDDIDLKVLKGMIDAYLNRK